jgi:curved DNA-binding protein CbpA
MSLIEQPGDLAEVPLAAVLIDALNGRATGVLTVEHDGGSSRVFLRDGFPVGAQSFTGFKPLGQALLADGTIDVDALGQSLAEMARTGKLQGELLVEMGAVTRAQVDEALSRQQSAYLTRIAGLAAGRFRFDAAAPVPPWTAGIRIRPLVAIVEALERPQSNALVVAALQPAAADPVVLEPRYGRLADAFGFGDAEAAFVARMERPVALDALFSDAAVPPERARAILAALLLLGLAAPRAGAEEPASSVTPVVVDLVDLAGEPVEAAEPPPVMEAPPWPEPPPPAPTPAAASRAPRPTLRRSDPEEARRRRQRLLQRAMQNMGVGPLSGPAHAAAHPAPEPTAAASAAAAAEARAARQKQTAAERELRQALEAAAPRAASADFFERLGLQRDATRDQVKSAYFQLAKQLHPDRFASPALADLAPRVKDLFAAVNEAYAALSDDRKRAELAARAGPGRAAEGGQAALDAQKAEACARTRDYAKARGFFEAALRADPRPEYQAAFAWMLMNEPRAPDLARARALAQAALRDPTCDRAAYVSGVLARDDGDEDRAERLFRQALAHNPRNGDADHELRQLEARRRARGGARRR